MQSLSTQLRIIKQLSIDNSPVILTAIGVAGVVSTSILSIKAARRADEKLAIAGSKIAPGEDFGLRQEIRATWSCYIPPAVAGATTITCIVLANRIGTKRAAALAAAFTISEKAFSEYQDKVIDILGEQNDQKVRDAVAQDRMDANPGDASKIIMIGSNDVPCYDRFLDRYFMSNIENIRKAQNDINEQLLHDETASLSDFYRALDLPITSMSDEVGWIADKLLDVKFGTMLAPDGTPCVSMDFSVLPVRNYWRGG